MADVEEDVAEEIADVPEDVVEEVEEIAEVEDEFVAVGATEVKLFGKWSFDDIEIRDISLEVRHIIW
jgi:small subunit ribosomal protein S5e